MDQMIQTDRKIAVIAERAATNNLRDQYTSIITFQINFLLRICSARCVER